MPVLNSAPEFANAVFLDFDGHTLNGTSWNGSGPLVCDAATLNPAQITAVFNRVSEDFRPFNLNVTTDSAKYVAAPATRRMRVILTPTWQWYGMAGGVAYINSFTWGDDTPCFVFTSLLNNNTKNIAEAAAHEIGHTLGLRHQSLYDAQCNKVSEYHSGVGSGEIGWAPIMGTGYYRNMTLWNFGSNPFACNAYQDDLSIITGNDNGVSYRTDDHASTAAGATRPAVANNAFTASGIIEKPGDADAFTLTLAAHSRLTVDASPYSIAAGNTGADLDVEVQLLDANETVIGTYNAATVLNAVMDTLLPAGNYLLRVQGKGNLFAPNYAVLGAYSLNATLTPGNALPVHKLQLKGIAEGKQHRLDWEIVADEKVVSQTIEAAASGEGFKPLASPDAPARSGVYLPVADGLVYYRLNALFDNGRRYYSNTIALRNNDKTGRPSLVGNVSNGTLTVSSPSACNYLIVDVAGRTTERGSLAPGLHVIAPKLLGNGVYLIQFDNGRERFAEKFSKR